MKANVTTVDIIQYLQEINKKGKEVLDEQDDDGFRTSRQISEELGLSITLTRQLLNEIADNDMLEVGRVSRKTLGGVGKVLAYRLKSETSINDFHQKRTAKPNK